MRMTEATAAAPRITQLCIATGYLDIVKQELYQFNPDMDRAYEFTEAAFDLISLMRIKDAAADRAAKVTQ
jgi:hypothetical protein